MLKKGDKVVMHTCGEAEHYNGKIWTVSSNEWELCGSKVVMLQGFSGAFACEYLQIVDLEEAGVYDERVGFVSCQEIEETVNEIYKK